MAKMGRPPIVDDNVIQKLEYAFSIGGSDLEACLYADISPGTLYNYQKDNPDFLQRKEMLKEALVLKARKVVSDSIENQDNDTSKWYLERKKKSEFSARQEQTGPEGAPIQHEMAVIPADQEILNRYYQSYKEPK